MKCAYRVVGSSFSYAATSVFALGEHGKRLLAILQYNKLCTFLAMTSSLAYGCLSYFEYHKLTQIFTDWRDYNRVFSELASKNTTTTDGNICPVPTSNINANPFALPTTPAHGSDLYNTIYKGERAVTQFMAIILLKPLLLLIIKSTLTYSLRSELIKKWLSGNNNQLGLRIIDHEVSEEAREIIDDYSTLYVNGLVDRASTIFDVISAVGKVNNIYSTGLELAAQGLNFNLLTFTAISFGVYFAINTSLNYLSKKQDAMNLKTKIRFRNDLTFNMENALQIESSQATHMEFRLLSKQLLHITKTSTTSTFLNITINAISSMFTNYFYFFILRSAIPSILIHPSLYFSIQKVTDLITQLCINSLNIFDKYSSTNSMSLASVKVTRFIHSINVYENIMQSKQDFDISRNDFAELRVNIRIDYPKDIDSLCNRSSKVLIQKLQRSFKRGTITAICGESGSGKSSFFNALSGINPFVSGAVTLPNNENIIYVPQKSVFKTNLSWIDTVLYPLTSEEYSKSPNYFNLGNKIEQWTKALKMDAILIKSKKIENWSSTLSGGEVQRLSLIQALARIHIRRYIQLQSNIVLLLDEAMNALDPKTKKIAFHLLKDEVTRNGITALHIDHSDHKSLDELYGHKNIVDFSQLKSHSI